MSEPIAPGFGPKIDKAKQLQDMLSSMSEDEIQAWIDSGELGSPSDANWRLTAAMKSLNSLRDASARALAIRAISAAESANSIASRSAKWAMYAAIIATVALIVSSKNEILALFM